MRVLVLLPTTGSLNRVLRIEPRRDLTASQVVEEHWKPLPISGDYHALTERNGLLGRLGPPFQPGVYELRLEANVESGNSWELPVVLAHFVVALGEELAETPATHDDIVLWSTGEVTSKQGIRAGRLSPDPKGCDYKLHAKVTYSRTGLQDAVAAGARIVVLVPHFEDPTPLRDLLNEIDALGAVVETVDSVEAACVIVKRELGHTRVATAPADAASANPAPVIVVPASPVFKVPTPGHSGRRVPEPGEGPPPVDGANALPARNWKKRALIASSMTLMLAVFVAGAGFIVGGDVVPRWMGAFKTSEVDGPQTALQPEPPAPAAPSDQPATESQELGKPPAAQVSADIPPQASVTPAAPLPVPVKLQEFRAANDGTCIPYLIERRTPPRTIDVALDGPGRFHDSAGRNLCMLEWTVNPEAKGVQGFDIEAPRIPGVQVTGTGSAGAWTKVRIEFRQEFTNTSPTTYTVRLKFNGAPPPDQAQQFRHTIR